MKYFPALSRHVDSTRSGRIARGLIAGLVVVGLVVGLGAWYWQPWQSDDGDAGTVVLQPVKHGTFRHLVTERGEIESSSNVEVACEVQSKNTTGTAILEIIPEGTNVKPGDQLVRLDASALKEQHSQQQILCNTSEAALIQAESALKTAQISKQEYLEGTFKQEEQVILGEMSVAEENLRRAQDYVRHSEKLAAKGFVTTLQLEADKFAVEKAKIELDTAKTKANVLRNFTKLKMLSQFEADIRTAEANLKSQENSHQLDVEKLKHMDEQIAKCVILAPAEGQVVYANKSDRRGQGDVIIEPGASVRERQAIIRLPDPKRMQVKAKINESRVDRVHTGQPVTIRLDAFPDRELIGTVTKVDDYPMAGSWFMTNIKEYATIIEIRDPPPGTRPGMTAEVKIRVEEVPDAIQIPVQAVVEHGGSHFALVPGADGLEARKIEIGSSNDKFVMIRGGLSANDQVVFNARRYRDRVKLPDVPVLPDGGEMLARKTADPGAAVQQVAATATTPGDAAKAQPIGTTAAANEGVAADASEKPKRRGGGMGGMGLAEIVKMAFANDKDGDNCLSQDEVTTEPLKSAFARIDSNSDGKIDRDEMTVSIRRMQSMMAGGGPGGQSGDGGGAAGGGSKLAAPASGGPGL